ncbi:MAG: hypothetical protein ACPGSO_04970 [Vicingaceae bacterium]
MKKAKLIWVFSGPDAEKQAKEKAFFLERLGEKEGFEFYEGSEYVSHISWLAYMIVSEEDQLKYLSEHKPTRVEAFED